MITVDSVIQIITTPPERIFRRSPSSLKRKGIYYYLYTIGGDEKYQYAYVMSKTSPMGPFEYPNKILFLQQIMKEAFSVRGMVVFSIRKERMITILLIWNLDGVAQTADIC